MPLSNAQSPQPVQQSGTIINMPASYRAALNVVGPVGIGVEIQGSGSASIFITRIGLTLAASDTITITVRSANSTGGTSSSATLVPLDSGNGAATATIEEFTVAPTPGAAVGDISAFTGTEVFYDFGSKAQPLTLSAAAEAVSISLTSGTTITGFIEWYEI